MRFAVALSCLLAGCAASFAELPPDDPRRLSVPAQHDREWAEEHDQSAGERAELDQLATRGRFDLQCNEATAVVLERATSGPLTLVGVAGCGRQVQYRRRLRRDVRWGRDAEHTRHCVGRALADDQRVTTRNTQWDRVDGSAVAIAID